MIAIKNMKMPKGCNNCNLHIFEEGWGDYCSVNKMILGCFELDKRPKDCPLVKAEEKI